MPRKTDGIEFDIHPRLKKCQIGRQWHYYPVSDTKKD